MERAYTILAIFIVSLYAVSIKRAAVIDMRQVLQGELAFISEGEALTTLDELYGTTYELLDAAAGIDTVQVPLEAGQTFDYRRQIDVECVAYNPVARTWNPAACLGSSFKRVEVTIMGPVNLDSTFVRSTVRLDRVYPKNRFLEGSEGNT